MGMTSWLGPFSGFVFVGLENFAEHSPVTRKESSIQQIDWGTGMGTAVWSRDCSSLPSPPGCPGPSPHRWTSYLLAVWFCLRPWASSPLWHCQVPALPTRPHFHPIALLHLRVRTRLIPASLFLACLSFFLPLDWHGHLSMPTAWSSVSPTFDFMGAVLGPVILGM